MNADRDPDSDPEREAAGDPDVERRMREAHEALEAARAAYEDARQAARDVRQAARERHREVSRAAREVERDAWRAERDARRSERESAHAHASAHTFSFDLGGLADLAGGDEHTEDLEKVMAVEGMARLKVRNVSGETRIGVGADGTVRVRARKRVRTTSADKAKRLLENVEVRIEQRGDEIEVRPHLYEQDRGWIDLFRGGRVAVDLDITLPREARVEAQTVSGDLSLVGTSGPVEVQSVSGDLSIEQVRGPLWVKTVSGDATCVECVGQLEANSVSGDLTFTSCRLRDVDLVTVSGDVTLDGELDGGDHRFKTISGDIELGLAGQSYAIDLRTMSGDLSCDLIGAQISREGRREHHVVLGQGATRVEVKTISGDLQIRPAAGSLPAVDGVSAGPASNAGQKLETAERESAAEARAILERLARGEVDVDAAAAALDATRGGQRRSSEDVQ